MPHLDEGMIHAWLEGALPPDEAALTEEHIASCDECSAAVAEARGLIAASSRILTALDDVPGGVIPSRSLRPRPWYMRRELQAAAAVVVVAGTTLLLMNGGRLQRTTASSATFTVSSAAIDTGVPTPAEAAPAPARAAESGKREAVESKVADEAARMPVVSRRSLQKPAERNQASQAAGSSAADATKQRFDVATGIASVTVKAVPEAPAAKALPLTVGPVPALTDSPMRVINVERRIGWGPRITYQLSSGVQVVLTEETTRTLEEVVVVPVDPKARRAERNRLRAVEKAKKDSVPATCARDTTVRSLQGVVTGVQTMSNASAPTTAAATRETAAPPAPNNSLRWTDPEGSSRYTLTGPLTCDELKRVRTRLGDAKR